MMRCGRGINLYEKNRQEKVSINYGNNIHSDSDN